MYDSYRKPHVVAISPYDPPIVYIRIHSHTFAYSHIHSHTFAYIHIHSHTFTYIHIRQQYSHLFHQASPSVATFLATDQPNVLGSYLKTCFAQRQTVLASPLLAWLLNFVELD